LPGEELGAVVGDDHVVFEAEAELVGDVDAGLVGEDHAGHHLLVVALHEVGPLVHVEADAVADAMVEEVVGGAVAGFDDDLAGGAVDDLHGDAGAGGGERGGLGVEDDFEDGALQVGGLAVDEAAGDVGGVAVDGAAVVDHDHFRFMNGLWLSSSVGDGGVGADVAGGVAADAAAGVGLGDEVGEFVVGVAGAAGEIDGFVDVEGDLVGETEESDFGGRLDGAAAGGDGRGGDELECGAGGGDGADELELGVLLDADGAGGDADFAEAAAEDVEGAFVFLPEVGNGGVAFGKLREQVGEVVALEERADDKGGGGLWDDVGEEALGLAPVGSGVVLQRGAGGDEDGVHAVLLHELAGEVEAGVALVDGDGDDVCGAVGEGEDGGGEGWFFAGGCDGLVDGFVWGLFLGVEGECGGGGSGGPEKAAAGNHAAIVGRMGRWILGSEGQVGLRKCGGSIMVLRLGLRVYQANLSG
jgi:hypothetical protein